MTKLRFTTRTFALLAFTLALTSIAQAQATRTWVSGVGNDANPCSRTAPCKTLAGAISKTAAGGEIDALDPAPAGTLTITKSITVDGTTGAGWFSTLNSGGINGFVINDSLAAVPGSSVVTLRNLSINGAGTTAGLNGIRFLSGKSLLVENTSIQNQSSSCLDVNPAISSASTVNVTVKNSTFLRCGTNGINLTTAGDITNTTIDNSTVAQSTTGITVAAGTLNINNSTVTGNSSNGINVSTSGGVGNVTNCHITDNGSAGVQATAGSTARVNGNKVYRNGTGLLNNGTMETWRNNQVRGNTTNLGGGVALTDVSAVGTGVF